MTPAEAIEAAEQASAETAYRNQLAREMYELGRLAGQAEHAAMQRAAQEQVREPPDPVMMRRIEDAARAEHERIQGRRWGPGGREHFADPRPGDFPGRQHEREREMEAG